MNVNLPKRNNPHIEIEGENQPNKKSKHVYLKKKHCKKIYIDKYLIIVR